MPPLRRQNAAGALKRRRLQPDHLDKSDLRWTSMLDAGDLVVEPRRLSSGVLGNTADRCLQCGVILVRRA